MKYGGDPSLAQLRDMNRRITKLEKQLLRQAEFTNRWLDKLIVRIDKHGGRLYLLESPEKEEE